MGNLNRLSKLMTSVNVPSAERHQLFCAQKKEDFIMLPSLALIILVGLAILITAPLGALGMDLTYRKLLSKA